jgi:ferritin-like metal-binding protein YciE
MKLDSIEALFELELQDLHSAEQQLVKALPKMADTASSDELKQAFETHLEQTQEHLQRLEKILGDLNLRAGKHKCKAMEGLIAEAQELLKADGLDSVRDAAMIGAAQRVEHYEMSGYGTARAFAEALGLDGDVKTLDDILEQESEANRTLGEIAEERVNPAAKKAA